MQVILISRHVAVQDWLHRHHPEILPDCVKSGTVSPEDITSSDVLIGVIPMGLAARAAAALVVEFSAPPRGVELTANAMEAAGARLVAYRVVPVDHATVLGELAQARAEKQARVDGLTGIIARQADVAAAGNPEKRIPEVLRVGFPGARGWSRP